MTRTDTSWAGVLIFIGAAQFTVAEIIAETLFPYYSVSSNHVSDLGAYCGIGKYCLIYQPGANMFNASLSILGISVVIGTFLLHRRIRSNSFRILLAGVGVSAIGIGLFPETQPMLHDFFSGMAFYAFGVMAIAGVVVLRRPFSFLSLCLGLTTLISVTLFIGSWTIDGAYALGIGQGGMERMAMYPVLLWLLAFGGTLMTPSVSASD